MKQNRWIGWLIVGGLVSVSLDSRAVESPSAAAETPLPPPTEVINSLSLMPSLESPRDSEIEITVAEVSAQAPSPVIRISLQDAPSPAREWRRFNQKYVRYLPILLLMGVSMIDTPPPLMVRALLFCISAVIGVGFLIDKQPSGRPARSRS